MTEEELKTGEEGLVEVLCFLCFPYICSWWDLPYKERIQKCSALRGSVDKIKQAGYVQLDGDQSLPENPYSPPLNITEEIWGDIVIATQEAYRKAGFKKVK